MGDIIRFRRRRWTRPRDYGARDARRDVTLRGLWREFLFWMRPVGLAAALIIIWMATDASLFEPPEFLSGVPEQVSESFTRCGPGRGHACVVDGDTFKLGDRKVRIVGIDAPETHPARCAQEALLGEQATLRLQALLNEGPFEMVGRIDDMQDRHGRDLRVVRRKLPDGSLQSIAADMRESGLARRYMGGFKLGWC